MLELKLMPQMHSVSGRILIVDDDPMAVELIAVRMAGLANTVLRSYGGRDAIDTARRELPDMIVLDLMMPDVSGFDVVQALRGHPDTARIPIIVLTAMQLTLQGRAQLNGYVTAVLAKTELQFQHFRAEVRRAMSGRRQAAAWPQS